MIPHPDAAAPPCGPLRPPAQVMRLARMGAAFPTRLSFMRSLLRRLAAERAQVARPLWEIDAAGHGRALYTVRLGGEPLSLVALSTPLAPEDRTDRVIAEAWDTSYVLFDGVPDRAELDRIAANAPLQEAGRFGPRDLVLSRANRSTRIFAHVADRLAAGAQPDPALIARVGYLMRTTAVYGNGKFGIADRARIAGRPALAPAFRLEMLAVWLIREFTHDLVEHVARALDPGAARLAPHLRRHLGIGNATGLGMAPFLVSHPPLLDAWVRVRETALARVRALPRAGEAGVAAAQALLARLAAHLDEWRVEEPVQAARLDRLRAELPHLAALAAPDALARPHPWDGLVAGAAALSTEAQELAVALALEPHGDLVDDLAGAVSAEAAPRPDPAMTVGALRRLIARDWGWARAIDFAAPEACRRFWYVSEEKLEPRLGDRHAEPGAERELPLDIARRVQALARDLDGAEPGESLARFGLRHPGHRLAVGRVQGLARHPYGEIRDNLIGADCRPIDMLRFKLAAFGAAKFDPRSVLWTRIAMYQGAPTRHEIAGDGDGWWLAALGVPA